MTRRLVAVTCLLAALAAAPAAAASPALKYESKTFLVPVGQENQPKGARCGGNWHVLSGGVFISVGLAVVNHNFPIDLGDKDGKPDDGWYATVTNQSGIEAPVTVYAVCTRSRPRYSFFNTSVVGELSTGQSCPDGTKVTGAGVFTSPTVDTAYIRTWAPFDFVLDEPRAMLAVVAGTGSETPVALNVICTDDYNLRYEKPNLKVPPNGSRDRAFGCPGDRRVVGGGARQLAVGTGWELSTLISSPSDNGSDDDIRPDNAWRVAVRNPSGEQREIPAVVVCAR